MMPANLAVFSVDHVGRLTLVRRYDIEDSRDDLFWSGIVCGGATATHGRREPHQS
jgi:hypothetical protein